MKSLTFKRIIKLAFTNFWRNRWLSAQATLILTVTLIFVLVFLLGQLILGVAVAAVRDKIDLTVYFKDIVPETQIVSIQNQLAARPDVKNVRYISKNEALQIWQGRPVSPAIKGLISEGNNPLPRSLQIKTDDAKALEEIAGIFSSESFKDQVRSISYQETKAIIDRLLRVTTFITQVGLALSVLFVIISVVVILNTIRLAIFTRREEVEIMRLVGASGGFVRTPFVIEASLFGLIAATIALGFLACVAWLSHPYLNAYLGSIGFDLRVFLLAKIWFLGLVAYGTGIGLAVISSLWEVKRHLRF